MSSTNIEQAQERKLQEGDMVQVKLTGETGMVVDTLFRKKKVRLPNHSIQVFHDFELTLLEEQDRVDTSGEKVSPPAEKSASETPNTIFDNEKVWNPQTQKYETPRAN
jgi:hypothetical protein